jgi:hypothetical protein
MVRAKSGAAAVRVVFSSQRGRDIRASWAAHDGAGLGVLKAAARQLILGGQGELDLGLQPAGQGGDPLLITLAWGFTGCCR